MSCGCWVVHGTVYVGRESDSVGGGVFVKACAHCKRGEGFWMMVMALGGEERMEGKGVL